MADRWMDERDRQWRDRDWRQSEQYGRGRDERSERWGEDRSWSADDEGSYMAGREPDWDRDYEEGGRYYGGRSPVTSGGGAYGAGGAYGGGESYGRGAAGRPQGYGASRGRFQEQDYTGGGRFYGDDERQRIYREDYGQGGREYGAVPRGYDAGYERRNQDRDYRADYRDRDDDRGSERFEERARDAGESLRHVGQKVASWFRGDRYMDDERGQRRDDDQPRFRREDFGREERRVEPERSHRGRGPQGWRRSDERISDDVHERLTDDPYLDASHIRVEVSNGEVTLSGSVEDRRSKHRAEQLVEDLSGVTHVQNNLRVEAGNPLTGSGRGFGSHALDEEIRSYETAHNSGDRGVSGLSGRTSTGALAERSAGTESDGGDDRSDKTKGVDYP